VSTNIYIRHDARCARANAEILAQFLALGDADIERRTHLVDGRFENVYPRAGAVPALEPVLAAARRYGARILECDPGALRLGWWFNAMPPGAGTAMHSHDENDERLSAVYYVSVPRHSGALRLDAGARGWRTIAPRAGRFVLFDPAMAHEVTRNASTELRLSVGMNLGPAVDRETQGEKRARQEISP